MVGRHWFGLCVSVESDLFSAPVSKLNGFSCPGVEIDLMLERGSKLSVTSVLG